jgi:AraC family transcriptional regulator of adaptative response / DNA-3-methyladenine glycosylase II
VFLPTDLGVRNALQRLGHAPGEASRLAGSWRPWRSYALMHLWQLVISPTSPIPGLATKGL